jgi:hypothetical protein
MGQLDSPTEAALARIKSENLGSSAVDGAVDKIANLGGMILEAAGLPGASTCIGFLTALKSLAVNKDEGNLIYFGDALVVDIRRLYRLYEELKQQFDERIKSAEFSAVVANATLHITRTNVESRLRRLAHIITNSMKDNDLEPESLDDMMKAAVELKEVDIAKLKMLYTHQNSILHQVEIGAAGPDKWHGDIQGVQKDIVNSREQNTREHLKYRSSYSRLESLGLIQRITSAGDYGVGNELYALLVEGKKFYERLQEISIQQ